MKIKNIFKEYVNASGKERQIGRYYASEISSIIKGYAKPKDFFVKRKIDMTGVRNIMSGQAFEAELKRAFDTTERPYEHEPKKEIKIEDFVIVVKPDFVMEKMIIETKFPVRLGSPSEYLERYKYQMECEHRAFDKPVYLGVFTHPFDLQLYPYHNSDKTWQEVVDAITHFHKKLCKLNKQ